VKIACVGGGPAGLYLSILMKLRDPGHDIIVFERNDTNSTSGWGVTFGKRLLSNLFDQDPTSARAIEAAAFIWRDQVTHIRGETIVAPGEGTYNISRRRLLDILDTRARELGVRVEHGREIMALSDLPTADLIVAADGVSSRIRQVAGSFQTDDVSDRNKYIWLGTEKIFDEFNFLFELTDHGWISAHAYGIDSESSTFIVECAPETWTGLGFDAMSADDALPILEGVFKEHLDGCRLIGELGDGSKARWLNFRTISNRHWHSGNIVLVGDSAHTAHYSIGMGTTLAIGDAIVLANNLHQHNDMETALLSYERQRQHELLPTLAEARCSALWFVNIARYTGLSPRQFGVLLYARRSPLIAILPPIVSYLLRRAAERVSFLNGVRDRIAPTVKVLYGRRKPALSRNPEETG
jgi:2-polyprenyl-6-methoxyphenol hydroxylase-like FAD-dependent oxidoreductase